RSRKWAHVYPRCCLDCSPANPPLVRWTIATTHDFRELNCKHLKLFWTVWTLNNNRPPPPYLDRYAFWLDQAPEQLGQSPTESPTVSQPVYITLIMCWT